jgi:hypothetical protein
VLLEKKRKRRIRNVNLSTPRHKCRGLFRVDPFDTLRASSERRFPSPPSKAGLSAVERVKRILFMSIF